MCFSQELIASAQREGRHEVHFHARGHPYLIDIAAMSQINMNTLMQRDIKATEENEEPSEEVSDEEDSEMEPPWLPRSSREVAAAPTRDERTTALVDLLLSPAVQVGLRERFREILGAVACGSHGRSGEALKGGCGEDFNGIRVVCRRLRKSSRSIGLLL